MAKVADQLVGRAAELRALDRAVDGLERADANALLVIGEPGIGKTRLLAELSERADARGCIVLEGSASELEDDLPFSVFVDALDEYVAGLPPHRLQSLDNSVRAELAQILPSLFDFVDEGRVALQDERYRAHRAVRELVERLAATKPLVLVLDDVHWADSASAELLGALLRRPPAGRVLLAIGARPRQLPARLRGALDRADRAGSLTRLALGGLRREEAGQHLGDAVDGVLADRLYAESGGNPFYLEQLARAPHPEGGARAAGDGRVLAGVPFAVAAALTEELSRLSPPTRALLEGAAVAGDPFEPELAAAAAAVDEQAAMQALDELLTVELVRRTEVPRRFQLRHPIVRRAVYESAPGGWLLGAHGRCADALAERGASAAARAHHVEHAARQGDASALALLREAGHTRPRHARPQAPHAGSARRCACFPTAPHPSSAADLLETIALVPDQLLPVRVRLTAACAGVEHLLGRHEEAHARLVAALEALPDFAAPEAVSLLIELSIDHLFRTQFDAMRASAERALAVARPLDDRPLTAAAAGILTLACAFAGAVEAADVHRAEAADRVARMPDDELARRIDAAAHLATGELYLDRFEAAEAHAERALAVARATGQMFPTLVPTLGTAHFMRGRLAEAAQVLDGGVEAARLGGNPQAIAWSLFNRSLAATYAGDVDSALDMSEEAIALTRRLDERFVTAWTSLGLAAALLPSGEPARAADVLMASLPVIPGGWRAMGLELLTRCHLELGRREDAVRAAASAEATAAALRLPMAIAWAQRAVAYVALDAERPEEAAERALASAAAADEAGAAIEAALSRALAGRALAQAGDQDRAVTALERAAAALQACGALRHRDAAERELRKLGRHIHRPTTRGAADRAGVEALSERELQVARLVVDRKTNREIAAELFVSLKTVEAHMRNLFRKLEVSSRVEVARAVERAERGTS